MRRVAGDEGASVAKLLGNQPPSVPILLRDDLIVEVGADAEDGADAGVAVHGIEIALAGPHVIVHQPALAAVDRIDHAAAARIDRAGAPGALVPLQADQVGRADEGRLHALHHGIAGKLGADRLANDRARAVAADQKAAAHAPDGPGFQVEQGHAGARLLDPAVYDRSAVDDADAGFRGRVLEQDRLEQDLGGAVRRLPRRAGAVTA